MRVGFIILAHQQPRQVARLVRHLRREGDQVWVHLDGRIEPATFGEVWQAGAQRIEDPVPSAWGTVGLVEATLRSLRVVCASEVEYVTLLSGADYPLRPIADYHAYLTAQAGSEFIEAGDRTRTDPEHRRRHERYWLTRRDTVMRRALELVVQRCVGERRLPGGLVPWSGSQWWTLTRPCATWLVHRLAADVRLRRFFDHVLVADELVFPTLLMHSPFRERVAGRNLRFIEWPPNQAHPCIWRRGDFERLRASGAFFARKFDTEVDTEILGLLDGLIEG